MYTGGKENSFANDCQGLARVRSGTLGRRWGMSRSEHVAEPPAAWWSTVSVCRRKGKKKVTPWSNAMEGLNVK
jgi:hypothetical protein